MGSESVITDEASSVWATPNRPSGALQKIGWAGIHRLERVNRELWLVLSLFILAAAMNFLIDAHRMVLGLYSLPTLFSAYIYGRRHATLTASASVFLVGLITYFNPARYFLSSLRAIILKGVGLDAIWQEILFMALFAAFIMTVSWNKVRTGILRS